MVSFFNDLSAMQMIGIFICLISIVFSLFLIIVGIHMIKESAPIERRYKNIGGIIIKIKEEN